MSDRLRVLTVDDWHFRHDNIREFLGLAGLRFELRQRMGPDEVTDDDLAWARVAFLDHDMCQGDPHAPEPFCPKPRDTEGFNMLNKHCGCSNGVDLVRRMLAAPHRPTVIVHTQNRTGGDRMQGALRRRGFAVHRLPADRLRHVDARLTARQWGLL